MQALLPQKRSDVLRVCELGDERPVAPPERLKGAPKKIGLGLACGCGHDETCEALTKPNPRNAG